MLEHRVGWGFGIGVTDVFSSSWELWVFLLLISHMDFLGYGVCGLVSVPRVYPLFPEFWDPWFIPHSQTFGICGIFSIPRVLGSVVYPLSQSVGIHSLSPIPRNPLRFSLAWGIGTSCDSLEFIFLRESQSEIPSRAFPGVSLSQAGSRPCLPIPNFFFFP